MNKIKDYHVYAFGTIFLWASAFVFTKVALGYFTASALGVLRYLSASLFLVVVAFIKGIGFPKFRDMPKFFLSGAMGFTLYMIAFNEASRMISSTTGSIIIATAPIITATFARVFFQERINPIGWMAIAIEFGGILVLTLWDGIFSINVGILWMLAAAFCISGYNLSQRSYTKKYTALQSTTYSIFAGTLLLFVFLPEAIPQVLAAPTKQILVIVYLGVFPSAIAYILWSKALSKAEKTSDVTNFMFVTPLLSMVMSYIIILEIPTLSTFVGGGIIMFGLVLFNQKGKSHGIQEIS